MLQNDTIKENADNVEELNFIHLILTDWIETLFLADNDENRYTKFIISKKSKSIVKNIIFINEKY